MFRQSLFLLSLVIGSFFFTGCAERYGQVFVMDNRNTESCTAHMTKKKLSTEICTHVNNNRVEIIGGIGEDSMLTHAKYNNSTAAALQMVAQYTIDRKHKFFTIVSPSIISNFNGSLINTPKEFFEKCDINVGSVLAFQVDPCQLHQFNKRFAEMGVITYEEQPFDVLAFNAIEVMEYLKNEGRYDEALKLKKLNWLK